MGAPLKDHRQAWQGHASPPATAGFVEAPYACFRLRPTAAAIARGFVRLLAQTPEQGDRLCIAPAFAETPLWLPLVAVCWAAYGAGFAYLLSAFGRGGTRILGVLSAPLAALFRAVG